MGRTPLKMRSLLELLKVWQEQNVGHLPPANEATIRRTFEEVGSRATGDVVALYQLIGGLEVGDNNFWRLWPLREVRKENQDSTGRGVLFSDYLICSWCYRLVANEDDTSAVYVDHFDAKEPALVASSLEQFFDLLLTKPGLLLVDLSVRLDAS